jgi:hypothetical protein
MEMGALIASTIPLGITLFIWIIKKLFSHEKKIFTLNESMSELHKLKIGSTLSNHELRITVQEEHKKIITEKLDKLIESNAHIVGLLASKKDKQ